MCMNNVYYRAVHLISNKEYATLPARLRMNVLANPGVEKVDFELWSTAVSAVHGCGMCLDAHEAELKKHGVTAQQVQRSEEHTSELQSLLRISYVVLRLKKTTNQLISTNRLFYSRLRL